MARLPPSLTASRAGLRPWHYVAAAVVLQALVIVWFYGAIKGVFATSLPHDDIDLIVVLGSGLITISLVSALAWQQHKRFSSEDRVRQRLLDVIDALPDPAAVRDIQGRYVLWNKAAESYHGIAAKFVVGKAPHELFPPETAKSILALDKQAMSQDEVVIQRLSLPPLYGKGKRTALLRCAPIHSLGKPGTMRGAVTILHDVTAEEEEAIALRYTAAQLKMALDTSGFGSWTWDLEHDVVSYSEQYEKLMRYEGKEFKKDFDFQERLHPGDSESVKLTARASIKENKPYSQVYRLLCFDGEYRAFHASGEPTIDQHGRRVFAGLLCPLDRGD
jgi:PAS domain S-box-containing protein